MFNVRDVDMLRVWMLLVMGAAAVRQITEDAFPPFAVKEWSKEDDLRKDVERVAKENFPEKEGQDLTEAVMKAFKKGEPDKGLKTCPGKKSKDTCSQKCSPCEKSGGILGRR